MVGRKQAHLALFISLQFIHTLVKVSTEVQPFQACVNFDLESFTRIKTKLVKSHTATNGIS